MTFAAQIYVSACGETFRAGQTDQAGTRNDSAIRTVHGRTVVWAGGWYGCQMDYNPFIRACLDAASKADAIDAERTGRAPSPPKSIIRSN
jgi:hypothetical protein